MVCLPNFLYFIFSFLSIKLVTSTFFNDSINDTSFLFEKLNDVLNHCFFNNSNFLIITKQTNTQMLSSLGSSRSANSIILINDEFQNMNDNQYYPELATFISIVDSVHEFENILTIVNASIWWNYDSDYVIIQATNFCNDAFDILNLAWKYRMLSATYLCADNLTNNITFYTYNPFTNRAPRPWMTVNNNNNNYNKLNESWTLFMRSYEEDNTRCVNLTYDRTKFMDGYRIKALAIPIPDMKWDPKVFYNTSSLKTRLSNKEYNTIKALVQTWNITLAVRFAITYYTAEKDNYDLLLTPLFRITWDRDITVPIYPFQTASMVIITQKRPFLTPEDKIISFYSPAIMLSCTVVCVMTVIMLIINKRQRFSTAMLEILRLVVYCGVKQPLLKFPIRIYFFGVYWLIVIINATFQGNLATFLTKPERISIETLEDLRIYEYDIYTYPQIHFNFKENFQSMVTRQIPHINGYKVVTNNSKVAYITPSTRGYAPAFNYQLHVSKPILTDYVSKAAHKRTFPFTKTIDVVESRCFEAGLLWLWEGQELYKFQSNLSHTEELETHPRFRPITTVDLVFAFKIFGIGIGCSIPVFFIEMILNKVVKAFFPLQETIKLYIFLGK